MGQLVNTDSGSKLNIREVDSCRYRSFRVGADVWFAGPKGREPATLAIAGTVIITHALCVVAQWDLSLAPAPSHAGRTKTVLLPLY